jgi:hypothetical protein
VQDGPDDERDRVVVEAGEGVLEVDGDAVGQAGGQAQDAVLTAGARQLPGVEGIDRGGPSR